MIKCPEMGIRKLFKIISNFMQHHHFLIIPDSKILMRAVPKQKQRKLEMIEKKKYSIISGGKFDSDFNDSAYKVDMVLHIRSVGPADFGSYKCVAKNSLGETDGTIKLYSEFYLHEIPTRETHIFLCASQDHKSNIYVIT